MNCHHPLVLIHGFGVRSYFWEALQGDLSERFDRIEAPDLVYARVEEGIEAVRQFCLTLRVSSDGPIVLIGHSLGGVISALAARELEWDVVSHLIVIASPFGNRVGSAFGPLLRVRHALGLVSREEIRRRFFGPDVRRVDQERIFAAAHTESDELRSLARQKRWFHTDAFPSGIAQNALCIASEMDKMVASGETAQFAHALGAEFVRFPASARIGHNDFGMHPPAAHRTAMVINRFLSCGE